MTRRSVIYPWSFVTKIFHNGQPSHGGDRKIFESDDFNFTKMEPWFSSFLVRERPFNLKGGVMVFFLKKYSDSQCC
jgi:hypothetical protein